MNTLKQDRQKQIVAALAEGNSIRATCRMTGTAKGTVTKLPDFSIKNVHYRINA